MYSLRYVRSDGKTIIMTPDSDFLIATVSGVTGYTTNLSTSQGYEQIGNSVDGSSVSGQSININGFVLGIKPEAKQLLLSVFAPQTGGRLYWEDKRWIDVYVKSSPTITQEKNSRFNMSLYAPYPYWRSVQKTTRRLGVVTKMFSFPVNYAKAHKFGEVDMSGAMNCYNNGSAPTVFSVSIKFKVDVVNPVITCIHCGKFLRLNGTMAAGDFVTITQENGSVIVEKTAEGETVNALDMLDDASDLFQLEIGDNVLQTSADQNGEYMEVVLQYYESWAGVMCSAV